jgi:hypothetical protein
LATAPPLPKSFEDAALRHLAVREELERVCGSSHFRTSKRSCEFLEYIVRVTLDGRVDSLKERSIGIDLFGRDTSYEPSSDATVRVRANEVRKRLLSYYASSAPMNGVQAIRIELPTGCYVPRFLSATQHASRLGPEAVGTSPSMGSTPAADSERHAGPALATSSATETSPAFPPIQALTLMRPALLALLVCTLLLRHQLENREEYLRFWDRLLSGRSAMVLAVSPQDRATLAPSLYPLVWVAGRYGVDATIQGDSLTGPRAEASSSVQVSYASSPEAASDLQLRWTISSPTPSAPAVLKDRNPSGGVLNARAAVTSAALLSILPQDTTTLHVQGTDAEAIRQLLEELTAERNFPVGLVDQVEHLDGRDALQVLVYRDAAGAWQREIFRGVG